MDWFGLLLGWVPLWAWIVLCGVIAAPILFYFGPVLLPIWNMLPRPIKLFFEAIVLALLAWAGGRYVGAKRERDEQARREANAIANRAEVDQNVARMDDKTVRDRLAKYNRRDE